MTFQCPGMYLFLFLAVMSLGTASLRRAKPALFLLLNAIFILLVFTHARVVSFIILLLWLAGHYLSLRLMLHVSGKKIIFSLWLVLTLLWFAFVKEYHWITQSFLGGQIAPVWWSVVGYSFILFRQIHLSINVCDGRITSIRFLDYLNYHLAFWTFLAGPIQRYDDFIEQMRLSMINEASTKEVLRGWNRMLWGLIKMGIIAPFCERFAAITTFTLSPQWGTLLLFVLSFPLYLYLNFSGYCDVVIGLARIVGFRLPENFLRPFVARNMVDFWSRWHISLSDFFRDYLYFPMLTASSRYFNVFASAIMATFISFFLMGIWHGSTLQFAVFGMLHGLGVVVTLFYGELLKAALSKEGLKAYKKNRGVRVAAIFLCQSYVIFTFLFFQYPLSDLRQLAVVFKGSLL